MFEKHRKTAFALSVILVVLWMAYIFSFSAANAEASSQESGRITEMVVRLYEKDYDLLSEEEQEALEPPIRGGIIGKFLRWIIRLFKRTFLYK